MMMMMMMLLCRICRWIFSLISLTLTSWVHWWRTVRCRLHRSMMWINVGRSFCSASLTPRSEFCPAVIVWFQWPCYFVVCYAYSAVFSVHVLLALQYDTKTSTTVLRVCGTGNSGIEALLQTAQLQ